MSTLAVAQTKRQAIMTCPRNTMTIRVSTSFLDAWTQKPVTMTLKRQMMMERARIPLLTMIVLEIASTIPMEMEFAMNWKFQDAWMPLLAISMNKRRMTMPHVCLSTRVVCAAGPAFQVV
jgi:Na+-translocating ferredoxin:NAD+ oxidoreductase RnfE subunit